MLKDVLCAELSVELLLPWSFNQNILKVFGIVKVWRCFCFLVGFGFGFCGLGVLLLSFVF